jgi:cystathionine beta-lyase/cystathionine gamma-synthase
VKFDSRQMPGQENVILDKRSALLHARIGEDSPGASVTPVCQTSAFEAGSTYFYSRKNNPNVEEAEQAVALLEGAKHCIAFSCGMSAIYTALDLLQPGDTVVLNKLMYGCSFKLFQRVTARRHITLEVLDLTKEQEIEQIPEGTRMVFLETPTNPFLETVNLPHVSEIARVRREDALLVVDNTWATPLFQHPLEHGADISIHSGTKYFGGHSDVMSGFILTDRDDLDEELSAIRFYGGMILSPFDAWLVRRSLQTLALRVERQQAVALEMTDFLRNLPQVERLYYPEVDGEQLTGYGGIIFFELRQDLVERYSDFAQALQLFETGTGMACVTSMIAQPYTGSHASMTDDEKANIGLGKNLVRLCFGLEDVCDLKEDIKQAFRLIES